MYRKLLIFLGRQYEVPIPVRLGCVSEASPGCLGRFTDLIPSVRQARSVGWREITAAPEPEYPSPGHWFTHLGLCPSCRKFNRQIRSSSEPTSPTGRTCTGRCAPPQAARASKG